MIKRIYLSGFRGPSEHTAISPFYMHESIYYKKAQKKKLQLGATKLNASQNAWTSSDTSLFIWFHKRIRNIPIAVALPFTVTVAKFPSRHSHISVKVQLNFFCYLSICLADEWGTWGHKVTKPWIRLSTAMIDQTGTIINWHGVVFLLWFLS